MIWIILILLLVCVSLGYAVRNLLKKYETILQLKRYSPITISSYSNFMLQFVNRFNYTKKNLIQLF